MARTIISVATLAVYVAIAVLYLPVAKSMARTAETGAEAFRLLLVCDSLEYEANLLPGNVIRSHKKAP